MDQLDFWPKVTVFGDSLCRISMNPDNGCWASYLNHALVGYFDVDIRGFDGYNTRWLQTVLPKLFTFEYLSEVEILVVFLGHNDSWQGELPLGLPVKQFEENYRKILNHLLDHGLERDQIIIITPSWYCEDDYSRLQLRDGAVELSKDLEHAKSYADAALRVAMDNGIDLVDWFAISESYRPLADLFYDGCHLSRLGSKMLYDELMPLIQSKIEEKYGKPLNELSHIRPYQEIEEYRDALSNLKNLPAKTAPEPSNPQPGTSYDPGEGPSCSFHN